MNTVAAMRKRRYANEMVRSHGTACFNDWLPERPCRMILPRWNYLHIHDNVIPALKRKGVTGEQLRMMLVEERKKIFERRHTY